jgi:hypothetical protein
MTVVATWLEPHQLAMLEEDRSVAIDHPHSELAPAPDARPEASMRAR